MVASMLYELNERVHEEKPDEISSIYFGGGTPSILPQGKISRFIQYLGDTCNIVEGAEITLEANPDDMGIDNLLDWKQAGINRLSIGVQSFDDALLTSMNRSHNANEAIKAIALAKEMGFSSLSVDIIFGLPAEGVMPFHEVVERFIALDVDHISAYSLTIEAGTAYHHRVKKGELLLPDEEEVERQFIYLIDRLAKAGYEQYEVSNFARKGHISLHNSSYWKGAHYIGIGPSAHSYDGKSRRWNIANNNKYMQLLARGQTYWETEIIDRDKARNEYLLTRSRTKWGLDLEYMKTEFNLDLLQDQKDVLKQYEGKYVLSDGFLKLNKKGLLLADRFASDLFKV